MSRCRDVGMSFVPVSEANVRQHGLVLAPFGLDTNMEIEEHLHLEKALQFLARPGPNLLDHVAAPADTVRVVRPTVADARAEEAEKAARWLRLLESIDDHRTRKRQLRVCETEHLLADDLGGKKPFGLISQILGRVPRLALRHAIDN